MKTEQNKNIILEALKFDAQLRKLAIQYCINEEDANDLVQTTYLKICQYAQQFQEGSNLQAWCQTIMKHTFYNDYKRSKKEKEIFDKGSEYTVFENTTYSRGDYADLHYNVNEINAYIARIPESQRRPFEMYNDGYKYEEIAEAMDLPLGTVKSRIHSTKKKLQSQISDYAYWS